MTWTVGPKHPDTGKALAITPDTGPLNCVIVHGDERELLAAAICDFLNSHDGIATINHTPYIASQGPVFTRSRGGTVTVEANGKHITGKPT